jgi:hypothetical protein
MVLKKKKNGADDPTVLMAIGRKRIRCTRGRNEKGIARSFVVLFFFLLFFIIILFSVIRWKRGRSLATARCHRQTLRWEKGDWNYYFCFFFFFFFLCPVYGSEGKGERRPCVYLSRKKGENCKSGASRSVGPELSTA